MKRLTETPKILPSHRRSLLTFAVAVLVLVSAVACGSGGGRDQPGLGQQVSGDFAGIPLPEGAKAFGAAVRASGVVTQSYDVTGLDPEKTFEFYQQALPEAGWEPVSAGPSGATDYRSVWVKDQQQLTVSTAPLASKPGGTNAQLSLQLQTT